MNPAMPAKSSSFCDTRRGATWFVSPRVAAVYPPEDAEDEEDSAGSRQGEVFLEDARELGDGENEHHVEEELDGGYGADGAGGRDAPEEASHGGRGSPFSGKDQESLEAAPRT
jgi:hypothetical protein